MQLNFEREEKSLQNISLELLIINNDKKKEKQIAMG